MDGSVIRAHQHAAGALGSEPEAEALGRSQGGFSTKIHLRVEGNGKPMTFRLTAGQRHEATQVEHLMEQGAVKRASSGASEAAPHACGWRQSLQQWQDSSLSASAGYPVDDSPQEYEHCSGAFNREIYRQRNQVERTINRLKQFRRVATRYEKRAENYLAMLTIAAIVLWL